MLNREMRKLHLAYKNMISRCYDPKGRNWPHYGGRGISVCREWRESREAFIAWSMQGGHALDLSLDRINNNGNYEPSNCRWATIVDQLNNQARCAVVNHDGKSLTISQWCEAIGATKEQRVRAYKRHSKYGATTFEEIFCRSSLMSFRAKARENNCLECGRTESIKWRKYGAQCNTCYHRWFRASKREAA
jgi:hypothetical protein